MATTTNAFGARGILQTPHGSYTIHRLEAIEAAGLGAVGRLPYSLKVLLEALLRNVDGFRVLEEHVAALAGWNAARPADKELPFLPARVVLQDFTGVPCLVDLAAMRDAMQRLGGDPVRINPLTQCDLVIDHSVQVDAFGSRAALTINGDKEFSRNRERYEFLKWGQQSLKNFRCVPPAMGIVHQVNLEYLARGVLTQPGSGGETLAFPDSCVGTDSHTTMINGLGVLGWGVGGIEAEAVMLGQPYYLLMPEVIGFRLTGQLAEGATATDLVLTVTQMLRKVGVVDKFVEFCGPGLAALSVPDRATISNMAPEYGATVGYFPIDQITLDYLRFTGRDAATLSLVDAYAKENGFFWTPAAPEPVFSSMVELELATVEPSLAGPKRPQDRVRLREMKSLWQKELVESYGKSTPSRSTSAQRQAAERGPSAAEAPQAHSPDHAHSPGKDGTPSLPPDGLRHGDVVIAAITSCTNTSNPDVMLAAGLLARKAHQRGLRSRPWVKTSLAPGSQVVTEYFNRAGLTADLEALGFHTVGYGCTTCIGNSGPLPALIEEAIRQGDLIAAAVLSGNRNFEGRVHPLVKANYLASPPLVVAYALAGTVEIDFETEPLGHGTDDRPVFLRDIWPTQAEIRRVKEAAITPEQYQAKYANVFTGNPTWNSVPIHSSTLYPWRADSTYIQNPPYFSAMTRNLPPVQPITGARCLVFVGDSVTTDHISPAGDIAEHSPAGQYLLSLGVAKADFNSYGSRRGNDRIMTRGTFANVRVKNKLALDPATGHIREGGWTRMLGAGPAVPGQPEPGALCWIYDASVAYQQAQIPLIVLAGSDYGMGSSRDWAAKGVMLLGVKAVIARSFERIHRSNLVGMGVLPLCFAPGESAETLGLTGEEVFNLNVPDPLTPRCEIIVDAQKPSGEVVRFTTICRIVTPVEVEYYRNGGVLHTVLRKLI